MIDKLFNLEYNTEYPKNLTVIIICLFIGVVVAAAVSLYHKYVLGSFVRFLRSSGAHDEETAIRLDKTKFEKNVFVRAAIINGRTYAAVLRSVLPKDIPAPESLSEKDRKKIRQKIVSESGYYIPEELSFRADNVFSKSGTSVFSVLFGILLFMIVAAVSLLIVPGLVELFKNWTGMV